MASIATKEERLKINLDLARRDHPNDALGVNANGDIGIWSIPLLRYVVLAEYIPARDCWEWDIPPELAERELWMRWETVERGSYGP